MKTKVKKYSLAYWLKDALRYANDHEHVIAQAVLTHFTKPDESPIVDKFATPLQMLQVVYREWKRRFEVRWSLYPTPLDVADTLADFAGVTKKDIVFDPGCGFGNLLWVAEDRGAKAFGVEMQEWIPRRLAKLLKLNIQHGDYLDGYKPGKFTMVLTNPPFGKIMDTPDATQAFLDRIHSQCKPGTRVGAILPLGYIGSEKPKARVATIAKFKIIKRKELPGEIFKPLTNICTEMVLLEALPAAVPKAHVPRKLKTFKPSKAAKKFARNLKPIHPFPARMAPEIAFDALPSACPSTIHSPPSTTPDPHYIAGQGLPLFERYDFVKQKRIRKANAAIVNRKS